MKKVALAVSVVSLSACASTQESLNRPVTETFHSTQSVREVAFCLADRNHTPALERDDGSRVVLIKNGYGAVSLAFSIYPEGTGSRIEYRRIFGTIGGIWRQCVGAPPEH
jgi:hypothetical protein